MSKLCCKYCEHNVETLYEYTCAINGLSWDKLYDDDEEPGTPDWCHLVSVEDNNQQP